MVIPPLPVITGDDCIESLCRFFVTFTSKNNELQLMYSPKQ